MESRLFQDAVIRELQIVGEAIKRLPLQLRQQNPDVPWQDIAGMRDKLVHDRQPDRRPPNGASERTTRKRTAPSRSAFNTRFSARRYSMISRC